MPARTTSCSGGNGVGDTSTNWTYLVVAVDASELELVRSERAGEFDYSVEATE